MDQIGIVARNALLPPATIVGDRSSFDESLKNECCTKINSAIYTLKSLIRDCPFPLREEWTSNSQDIVQVLILCGEHSTCSDWNTQELVNNVNDLIDLTLSKLGFQCVEDLFAVENLVHSILQELKLKLGKDNFKKYPAAVNCFVWVLTKTLVPSLDTSVDIAVPVSLVLFDDWEPDYQQKGLECISHILHQNPIALQPRGWPAVISSALKKSSTVGKSSKLKIFKCIDLCLKAQSLDTNNPSQWNSNDQYDSLVNDLLQSMMIQDSLDITKCNLEILVILFQSIQIRMAKFLPVVVGCLDVHINIGVAPEIHQLAIKVVEQIIEYCWICLEPQFINQLVWILFKLTNETDLKLSHPSIKRCEDLLEQLSSTCDKFSLSLCLA